MKQEDREYLRLRVNETSYNKYMKAFQKGSLAINEAYLAMERGMEFGEKLRDAFKTANRAAWRKKWQSHMNDEEIDALEKAFEQNKPNLDIEAILLPHVSNKGLADEGEVEMDAWEDLFKAFKKKKTFDGFYAAADNTDLKSVVYMDSEWDPLGD